METLLEGLTLRPMVKPLRASNMALSPIIVPSPRVSLSGHLISVRKCMVTFFPISHPVPYTAIYADVRMGW